jgi:aspartate racemase
MKTIGLLGGMSWESTVTYYTLINEGVREALGGLHSAEIILYSVEFDAIEHLQHQGDWDAAGTILSTAANKIEACGADILLICTNTMHKVAPAVEQTISIPLLHIADATAEVIKKQKIECVGLLGTRFTMEDDFYKGRLRKKYGIEVCVPEKQDRALVHRVIYDELCCGIVNDRSRGAFARIITSLSKKGAEAVILGCTEIALLIQQEHTPVPLLDTTAIHAAGAVKFALGDKNVSGYH